jgi:hypothetical protein
MKKLKLKIGDKITHNKTGKDVVEHVRGFVDGNQVVTRFWNSEGSVWEYGVKHVFVYQFMCQHGLIKVRQR